MRLTAPRTACFFSSSQAEAVAFLLALAADGIGGTHDAESRFPRVLVPSLSQEALNERVDRFRRQAAETERLAACRGRETESDA